MSTLAPTLSTSEVCGILGKSEKTVQRYIKRGLLHPESVRSERGTPEYRFTREEVETLRGKAPETLTPPPRRERETGRDFHPLLQETVRTLTEQLKTKDNQIGSLNERLKEMIERDRERNVLMRDLQEKITLLLPAGGQGGQTGQRGQGGHVRLEENKEPHELGLDREDRQDMTGRTGETPTQKAQKRKKSKKSTTASQGQGRQDRADSVLSRMFPTFSKFLRRK